MTKPRRWIIKGKRDVVLEDFDFDPGNLGPEQVAVQTQVTAVSSGTECANYLGLDPDVYVPGSWCAYPWIPGYAGVGTVTAIGSAVQDCKVGDTVIGLIPHASHAVIQRPRIVKDPGIDSASAAWIRLFGICMTALQVLNRETFPTIGVWGQGMIGLFCAQLLREAGAHVVGVDPVPKRRETAIACGISMALDPQDADFAGEIRRITRGHGFDVVVDTTGHPPTTVGLAQHVKQSGQIILMTHWRSAEELNAAPLINSVFQKGLQLTGALETMPGSEPWNLWPVLQQEKWKKLQALFLSKRLTLSPIMSYVASPSECRDIYETLCFRKEQWIGVNVDWSR